MFGRLHVVAEAERYVVFFALQMPNTPSKRCRIHNTALHGVRCVHAGGAHVDLRLSVACGGYHGEIGLWPDLPSGFRFEGLAQIHAYRELPDMLKVAVGMEQIAALIELRRKKNPSSRPCNGHRHGH